MADEQGNEESEIAQETIGSAEAALLLGVTPREVRRKAAEGILPGRRVKTKFGVEWRFVGSDVDSYREQQASAEGAAAARAVVRTEADSEVFLAQLDAHAQAMLELGESLSGIGALGEQIEANTQAQHEGGEAIQGLAAVNRELTTTLKAQGEEIAGLRQELAADRAERRQSWWQRLLKAITQQ